MNTSDNGSNIWLSISGILLSYTTRLEGIAENSTKANVKYFHHLLTLKADNQTIIVKIKCNKTLLLKKQVY